MVFNIEKADVIWKWNEVYPNLGNKAEALVTYFIEDIQNSQLPDTTVEMTQLKVGLIFGGRREYIELDAKHLRHCKFFIAARPYGRHLSVSAFLAFEAGIFSKGLNTFEYQDLGDYLESAELSLKEAVTKIAKESGIDPKELKTEFKEIEINRYYYPTKEGFTWQL